MKHLLFLTSLLLTSAPAQALDCTWTGGTSDWETDTNWSCGEVPDADDSVTISSGTVTLNADHTVSSFSLSFGTLTGTGTLTAADAFTWSAGTISTDVTLAATGTGTFSGSAKSLGSGATLRLNADTDWTGSNITGFTGAVLRNTATLTALSSQAFFSDAGFPGATPAFENEGTFVHDVNASVTNSFMLTNDGTVEVRRGTSEWREGGTSTGTFDLSTGATLDLSFGTFDLSAATVAGAGTAEFGGTTLLGGTMSLAPGGTMIADNNVTLSADETVPNFTLPFGTLAGSGTLTVTGTLTLSGGNVDTDLTLAASGSGTITGGGVRSGATLRLDGDTDWTAGAFAGSGGAVLHNTATLTSTSTGILTIGTNPRPTFDNDGTFIYNRDASSFSEWTFDNSGTVEIRQGSFQWDDGTNAGTLHISAGATSSLASGAAFTNAASGVIGGSGTFDEGFSSFVNEGTFAPGASPGLLTYLGTYAMNASSVLDIELGGTIPGEDYDRLAVTDDAMLGGTLRLGIALGEAPQIGDTFTILTTGGTRSGTFATVEGPFGYTFDVRYNAADVEVEVLAIPNFDLQAQNTTSLTVPQGGSVAFDYAITNNTAFPITGDFWFTASPGGFSDVIQSGTLPGETTINPSFVQPVPGFAPPGTYSYTLNIGQFPNTVVGSVPFEIVVTPAASRSGATETWAVQAATPWIGRDGTVLSSQEKAAAPTTEAASSAVPEAFGLTAAYPNPFRGSTTFDLDVPEASKVTVAVYDALGRRVAVLLDGEVEAATHQFSFDASRLPSGVYLVRATGPGAAATQRVALVR